MSIQDELMSQDQAFPVTNENQTPSDTFTFDAEPSSSPVGNEGNDKEEEVTEESEGEEPETPAEDTEEQKVPYSRFKKKVDEIGEYASKIQFLEERLADLENNRKESATEDIEVPEEWTKLYGDSDVAKEAFKIQAKREEQIAEKVIREALERIENKQKEEIERITENEEIIDESLSNLSEQLGKKFSKKEEEDILTIVDEFSPVGQDGKYLSMLPFDKAYEIYTLRQSKKGAATKQARTAIADLTRDSTNSEPDNSTSQYKPSWDNWRDQLS